MCMRLPGINANQHLIIIRQRGHRHNQFCNVCVCGGGGGGGGGELDDHCA